MLTLVGSSVKGTVHWNSHRCHGSVTEGLVWHSDGLWSSLAGHRAALQLRVCWWPTLGQSMFALVGHRRGARHRFLGTRSAPARQAF
jgi:hypothetical protein